MGNRQVVAVFLSLFPDEALGNPLNVELDQLLHIEVLESHLMHHLPQVQLA